MRFYMGFRSKVDKDFEKFKAIVGTQAITESVIKIYSKQEYNYKYDEKGNLIEIKEYKLVKKFDQEEKVPVSESIIQYEFYKR